MKKTKKALASLALAGMVLSIAPAGVFGAIDDTRIYGADRYLTSIEVAKKAFGAGAETAVIAAGNQANIVDALAAAPFAAQENAPVMLTDKNDMNDRVKGALSDLGVKKVYVVGAAASDAVVNELKAAGFEVEAIKGAGRVETAKAINEKLTAPAGSFVVGYNGTPDAMSVASYAAANNYAIVVANQDGTTNGATGTTYVVGGTKLVKDIAGAERLAGDNRYETNKKVIDALEYNFDTVYVANGVSLVDALVASVLAGQTDSAIALTNGKTVEADLASKISSSSKVVALGGVNAVSDAVLNSVRTVQALDIVSVTALDDDNRFLEIAFNRSVGELETSDIAIQDAKTGDRYGVKEVKLSADGRTATVELFAREDAGVLKELTDYNVTVNVNGQTLQTVFNRPAHIEGRIVDINAVDNEFVIYDDETGKDFTLEVAKGTEFDYEGTVGELVNVWYNKDKEVVKYSVDEADALYDSIEITDEDEIKLLTADKKYDISTDEYDDTNKAKFKFFLNGEPVKIGDEVKVDDKYNFAKVGFDKSGDIEYVNAYTLNDFLVVESVEDEEVIGVEGSGSYDAEDATIIKDGKVISLEDLQKGDLLFFYENDDEKKQRFAEVYNNTVVGEIDTVYSNAVEVDGETYDFIYDNADIEDFVGLDYLDGAVYLNEDGELETLDSDAAEELQAAGEATLYLDRAGNLVYIGGELAEVDSNTKTAIFTEDIESDTNFGSELIQIEVVTEDDDNELYQLDVEDLKTITVDGEDYDIDDEPDANEWKPTVTAKNIVLDNATKADVEISLAQKGNMVQVKLDDDGDVVELEFFKENSIKVTDGALEPGSKYAKGMKLTSNTIVFDITDGTDASDIKVSTWADHAGSDLKDYTLIHDEDDEVIAIGYTATTTEDKAYDEAVITNVLRNTDDEVTKITAFIGGEEKTLAVDEVKADIKKGSVAVLVFDEDNNDLVEDIIASASHDDGDEFSSRVVVTGSVDNVDLGNSEVTIDGKAYRFADKGLVLDTTDTSDITEESLRDLRGEENVTVVLDAKTGRYAKFFVIVDEAGETALEKAIDAVVKAEKSETQADVDAAKKLVDALAAGNEKTDLQERIDVVQDAIDAENNEPYVTAPVKGLTQVTGQLNLKVVETVKATGLTSNTEVDGVVDAEGNFTIDITGYSLEQVEVQAYDADGNTVGEAKVFTVI